MSFPRFDSDFKRVLNPVHLNAVTSVSCLIPPIIATCRESGKGDGPCVTNLWARFPYKFLRNLNTKLGRISLPSISQLLLVMEKCQHSIKATFKRVKSQIQKGAIPERAVRRGYENTCLTILRLRIRESLFSREP